MSQPEYPDQDYYPSAKLRLIIRFEEFGNKAPDAAGATAIKKPPIKFAGIKDAAAPLTVQADPGAPAGVKRKLIAPPASNNALPASANSSQDSLTHVLGGIIPKEASWSQNGPRTADTLNLKIKYIDCPVDPRTIRSCAVEFYFGTVTAEEFALGVTGGTRGGAGGPEEPLNIVPDTYLDDEGNQRTNLRFQGWVDAWDVEWDDEGEPMITFECRDNTSLLIEQQEPPKLVMDGKLPLDQAVAGYLANFPQLAGISVEYRPNGADAPKVNEALAKTAFRPNMGPHSAKGGGAGGGEKNSVWDYLTDVCRSVGHMIVVEGTTVVVQRVRTFTGTEFAGRVDDPFQGRDLPSGHATYRRFIYGRNVKSMKVGRKFVHAATNIEVRCYSGRRKKVLVARFPTDKDIKSKAVFHPQPGDGKEQKWFVVNVSGVEDEATLRVIAQSQYEQMGRRELSMEVKTKNMASFGAGNTNPDILDMKAGDSFEVLVNRSTDEVNSLTAIEDQLLLQSAAAKYMTDLGFADDFAQAYAKAYADSGFQTAFRLRQMTITWNADEGVEIHLVGANYIEVRLDAQLPQGESQSK